MKMKNREDMKMKFNAMTYTEILRALRGHDFDTIANSLTVDDAASCVYSRADAFADHYLIDVTLRALELDIYLPVAVTAATWIQWIAVPGDREQELSRLYAMLGEMKCVVKERLSLDERFHVKAFTKTGEEQQEEVRVLLDVTKKESTSSRLCLDTKN